MNTEDHGTLGSARAASSTMLLQLIYVSSKYYDVNGKVVAMSNKTTVNLMGQSTRPPTTRDYVQCLTRSAGSNAFYLVSRARAKVQPHSYFAGDGFTTGTFYLNYSLVIFWRLIRNTHITSAASDCNVRVLWLDSII